MLARLQWLLAGICAIAIVLPASFNVRTDSYAWIWQSDDGPLFLIWLVPLAACALGRLARPPWLRSLAGALQCLLALGVALVVYSISSIGETLFFSEIAWGGWVATGAALAFAGVSAARSIAGLHTARPAALLA